MEKNIFFYGKQELKESDKGRSPAEAVSTNVVQGKGVIRTCK